jgi:hypothetical protein
LLSYAPTLLGSTTPRLWTPPLVIGPPGPCGCGCALTPDTSLGFSAVEFAADPIQIRLFPWQRWLFIHSLELRPDGRFRFRTVLVLVARQNGKTTWVEVKNLWKMFVLRVPLVIGTAQNLDISEESWDKAVEIVESIPDLAAEIRHVDRTNGKKSLRLDNGSRWKITAASRRGGRGLSGDDVNLDELREHHTWDAWGAVSKTTMARRNAQIGATSNAGDDKSVVLNALQAQGRAVVKHPAGDSSFGYFDWSAPDDVRCTCIRAVDGRHAPNCRLRDRAAQATANPSLGYDGGVSIEALDSALETDPEQVYRTECLCQRVPNLSPAVIPETVWQARGGLTVERPNPPVCFALAAAWPDAEYGSIGLAGRLAGEMAVQVVDHHSGIGWMVDRAVELADRHPNCGFVLDEAGPAGQLKPDLVAAGFTVQPKDKPVTTRRALIVPTAREVGQAFGGFHTYVTGEAADIRHYGQPELADALAGAQTRPVGDAQTWARQTSAADISPLEAVTLAAWWQRARPANAPFFAARR